MVDVQVELSLAEAALDYAGMGLAVHPLWPRDKKGILEAWQTLATSDAAQVRAWWQKGPAANVGMVPALSGQLVIDVDPGSMDAWRDLVSEFGAGLEATWLCETPRGGLHVHYALAVGDKERPAGELATESGALEVLWAGNVVMPPSVHPNGGVYGWAMEHSPEEVELAPLPAALRARIMRPKRAPGEVVLREATPELVERAREALARLGQWRCDEYKPWFDVGCSLSELGDTGLALWEEWSKGSDKWQAGACAAKWRTIVPGDGLTLEALFSWANRDSRAPEEAPPTAGVWMGPDLGASGNGGASGVEYVVEDRVELLAEAGADDKIPAPGLEVPAKRRTHWTAAELLAADLPAPVCVVPGLLLEGLTILAGRPKLGKSFMALQLAVAVATGGVFLDRRVGQGRVLYIALEDSPKRLQERLRKMGVPADCDGLALHLEWPALNGNGVAKLRAYIGQYHPALIVIDTLSRAVGGALDWDKIGVVTDLVGPLQSLAQETGTAVLAVDHHRKGNGNEDVVDDVAGSTGKTAVADTLWGLYRDRTDHGAKLVASGRDVETGEIAIEFDGLTACWQAKTGATQGNRGKILDAIGELGVGATVVAIAKYLDSDHGNVSKELADLTQRGLVQREKRGAPYMLTARGADLVGGS